MLSLKLHLWEPSFHLGWNAALRNFFLPAHEMLTQIIQGSSPLLPLAGCFSCRKVGKDQRWENKAAFGSAAVCGWGQTENLSHNGLCTGDTTFCFLCRWFLAHWVLEIFFFIVVKTQMLETGLWKLLSDTGAITLPPSGSDLGTKSRIQREKWNPALGTLQLAFAGSVCWGTEGNGTEGLFSVFSSASQPQIQRGGTILPSCSCFVSLQEGSECAVTCELLEPAAQPGEEGEQGPHHPQWHLSQQHHPTLCPGQRGLRAPLQEGNWEHRASFLLKHSLQ